MLATGFSAVLNRFPHHEASGRRPRLGAKRGATRPAVAGAGAVAAAPPQATTAAAATTLRRWLSR
ncbi:hypothetical protein Q8F55_006619 [Vanrija albida]|uniref:Uncharacterized protein n=1 Tax=Vanrija albida TaxID=181172 RepID=A0ABR3PXQ3_9TREE